MSIPDELSQIESRLRDSDDLQELAQLQARCELHLANAAKAAATEADPTVRQTIESMRQQAESVLARAKERYAQIKVARMDPNYDRNKADDAARRQQKQLEDLKKAQQFLAGGGLGNLLGGLMGAAAGMKGVPGLGGQAAPSAPQATGSACPQCGAPAAGAKFCAQCGSPVSSPNCSGCGSPLAAGAKFCPNCGAKA